MIKIKVVTKVAKDWKILALRLFINPDLRGDLNFFHKNHKFVMFFDRILHQ